MKHAVVIFLGGGLGSLARWLMSRFITGCLPARLHELPFGILACNLTGCLLIGVFFGCLPAFRPEDVWRSLLVTGFLGGFTTFSSFAEDSHRLFVQGEVASAVGNVVFSVLLSLACVALGHRLGSCLA